MLIYLFILQAWRFRLSFFAKWLRRELPPKEGCYKIVSPETLHQGSLNCYWGSPTTSFGTLGFDAMALASQPRDATAITFNNDVVKVVASPPSQALSLSHLGASSSLALAMVEAFQGKAPQTSSETVDAPPNRIGKDSYIYQINIEHDDSALCDLRIMQRLLKMMLLPLDWEEQKNHPLDEIISSTYTALIGISLPHLFVSFFSRITLIKFLT